MILASAMRKLSTTACQSYRLQCTIDALPLLLYEYAAAAAATWICCCCRQYCYMDMLLLSPYSMGCMLLMVLGFGCYLCSACSDWCLPHSWFVSASVQLMTIVDGSGRTAFW